MDFKKLKDVIRMRSDATAAAAVCEFVGDINGYGEAGWTLLITALYYGKLQTLEALRDIGADALKGACGAVGVAWRFQRAFLAHIYLCVSRWRGACARHRPRAPAARLTTLCTLSVPLVTPGAGAGACGSPPRVVASSRTTRAPLAFCPPRRRRRRGCAWRYDSGHNSCGVVAVVRRRAVVPSLSRGVPFRAAMLSSSLLPSFFLNVCAPPPLALACCACQLSCVCACVWLACARARDVRLCASIVVVLQRAATDAVHCASRLPATTVRWVGCWSCTRTWM
jgi:hypothetical protein